MSTAVPTPANAEEEEGGHEVALSLGSNCGDRLHAIGTATEWLASVLDEARWCDSYETAPVGGGTRPYLNSVIIGRTRLADDALNHLLKEYEKAHGRDDAARARGDVPIDIDLVVSSGKVLRPRDFQATFFSQGYESLQSSEAR